MNLMRSFVGTQNQSTVEQSKYLRVSGLFFQDLVTSLNQNEGEDTISYNPNEQTKNMRILTSILEYRNTCEDEEESDEETVKDKESDDDYVESVEDEYEEEEEDYEEEDEDYEEEGSISIPDSYLATWRHS
jgi:hypothetical protein